MHCVKGDRILMSPKHTVTFSIVSHGQGPLIRPLLMDLRTRLFTCYEIVLTLNIPEDESFIGDFSDLPIRIVRNQKPKGFGANHNAAFRVANMAHFVVVNPDVRLDGLQIELLLEQLKTADVGIAAPVIFSSDGQLQDSARLYPSLGRLIARRLAGHAQPDYRLGNDAINVDWVGGMFMVFRSTTFREIDGFDEHYFMYFEDVDLCKRLHDRGYKVLLVPGTRVVHDAQRASHHKLKYFIWHMSSTMRFLVRTLNHRLAAPFLRLEQKMKRNEMDKHIVAHLETASDKALPQSDRR
jgi:N-acetylglucosaminyl-diphospho-decaprenol L-rhamnosyltransferase